MPTLAQDEKRWRAESDARTLAEAETIKQDEKRLSDAQVAAKRMAEEEAERLKAMRKVAGRKGTTATNQKQTSGSAVEPKIIKGSGGSSKHKVFQRI